MLSSNELADPRNLPTTPPVKTTGCTASQFHRVEVDGTITLSIVPVKGADEVTVHLYSGDRSDLKVVVNGDVLNVTDVRSEPEATPHSTVIGKLEVHGPAVIGTGARMINYGSGLSYSRQEAQSPLRPLRVVVILPPELNVKICHLDGAVGVTDNMTTGIVSVPHYVDVTMQEGDEPIRR